MANGSNLQNLSDEELLALESNISQNVQPMQAQRNTSLQSAAANLSNLSNDQLIQLEKQVSQQQIPQFRDATSVLKSEIKKRTSAVNLLDRLKLAFSDSEGAERFLREEKNFKIVERLPNGQLVAGNTRNDLRPVDPEGFMGDFLGEIVDKIDDAVVIGASALGAIKGAALGTVVAPGAGTLVVGALGAGAGAGAGQGAVATIGHRLGVRENNLREELVEVAINGAFGTVGEGAGAVLARAAKAGSRPFLTKVGNLIDNIKAKSEGTTRQGVVEKILPKTFKITANVPEDATEIVLRRGSDKVFNRFNTNPKNLDSLVTKIKGSIRKQEQILGSKVGRFKNELLEKTGDEKIVNVSQQRNLLNQDLQDLGILDARGELNRGFLSERGAADLTVFRKLLPQIQENNITTKQALLIRDQLNNVLPKLSPQGKRIANNFLRGNSQIGSKGIVDQVNQIAKARGADRFLKANQDFSDYKQALEELTLDPSKETSIASFINGFLNKNAVQKRFVRRVDELTDFPILDDIETFAAAQAFRLSSPNMIRFGSVAGLFGATTFDSPEGKLASLGAGILLGTPAGAKQLLKLGDRLMKVNTLPRSVAARARKTNFIPNDLKNRISKTFLSPQAQRATLARLLATNQERQ